MIKFIYGSNGGPEHDIKQMQNRKDCRQLCAEPGLGCGMDAQLRAVANTFERAREHVDGQRVWKEGTALAPKHQM